jgi:hypothetical protein
MIIILRFLVISFICVITEGVFMKIGDIFRAAALSLTLGLSAQFAQAQETTMTFPNGKQVTFDCGLLYIENGKLYLSEEAILEIDKQFGGASISPEGLTSKSELSSDPKVRGLQLSKNANLFAFHAARAHKHCVSQYGRLEFAAALITAIENGTVDVPEGKSANDFIRETTAEVMKGKVSEFSDEEVRRLAALQVKRYGENWPAKTSCIIVTIREGCKPELGLD